MEQPKDKTMAKGLIYKTNATVHVPVMNGGTGGVMEFGSDAEANEYATVDAERGDRDYAIVDLEGLTWNQAPAYEGKKEDEDEDDEKSV